MVMDIVVILVVVMIVVSISHLEEVVMKMEMVVEFKWL